jgi:GT2 family glycosyltransferase
MPQDQNWENRTGATPADGAGQTACNQERSLPEISVIVPTYNRRVILDRCLRALEKQTLSRERFEVIVIDDGSTDGSRELVAQFTGRLPVTYLHQVNSGTGTARKHGVQRAAGEFLLLMNDDTICEPTVLEEHLRMQRQAAGQSLAVLGSFEYPPAARKRALTHFMATDDFMFPFASLKSGTIYSYSFFITCNLSIRRDAVLQAGSFDGSYLLSEDTELGIRLDERGWRVLYHPAARAWHDHLPYAVPNLIRRSRVYGRDYVYMLRRHPRCLNEWRLPVPVKQLDHSALAPLREFLDRGREEVERTVEALARFDEVEFEPLLEEGPGSGGVATILQLFRQSVPSIHWYYMMESMYQTLLWEQEHPGAQSLAPVQSGLTRRTAQAAAASPLPASAGLEPNAAVTPETLFKTLHEQGLEAFRQGKLNEAVIWFKHALQKHETSVVWNDWATAQFQIGRFKEAEQGVRRALALDAGNTIAASNLERFLQASAKRSEGVSHDSEFLRRQLAVIRARGPLTARKGRNLVIGLAANYRRAQVEPFLCSLRRSGYTGDIVLFVTGLDEDMNALFRQYRVTAAEWKDVPPPFDMMLGRFFRYYNFLAGLDAAGQSYDFVLISDIRDVFFQRDPFLPEPRAELLVFLEDKSKTLGTCPYNSAWIREVAGEAALARLANQRISCAGTTLGSWSGILEYLIGMQLAALEYSLSGDLVQGVDQGMHNVLVHGNLLRDCRTVENGERVLTLHYVPQEALKVNSQNEVIGSDGQPAAVVHQYDRHPQLCQLVEQMYA